MWLLSQYGHRKREMRNSDPDTLLFFDDHVEISSISFSGFKK